MKTTFQVIEASPPQPIEAADDSHPDILDTKRAAYNCGVAGIEYLRRSAYIHIQQDITAQERLTEFMNEYFKEAHRQQEDFEVIEPPDSISIETPLRRIGKAALRNFHFDRVILIDPPKIMNDGDIEAASTHLASVNVPYPEGKIGLALVDYSEDARQVLASCGESIHTLLKEFAVPVAYVQPAIHQTEEANTVARFAVA
jgi:cobalamin biosynthesis Co2+ chelatase CbiK